MNLAARLQSIAEPGHIVISYETYAFVRDILIAHPLPPITMKGISREVIPYAVEGMLDEAGQKVEVLSEHIAICAALTAVLTFATAVHLLLLASMRAES